MNLIKRIPESELRKPSSRCTGNDASGNFYTTRWNPSDARDLKLSWRKSVSSGVVIAGFFHLYLEELIRQDFCKREEDKIRFTIWHDDDRWLRVRIRRTVGGVVPITQLDW